MDDELNRNRDSEFSVYDSEPAIPDKLFNDLQILIEKGNFAELFPNFGILVPLARQLNKSVEPFCWRQQYGLSMDEMFPDHFEELLDMNISRTGCKLRPVQKACAFAGNHKIRHHTKYNGMTE